MFNGVKSHTYTVSLCFRSDYPPKMKSKMQNHFRPKTKVAETIKNYHFRHRKWKRNSVDLDDYQHLVRMRSQPNELKLVTIKIFLIVNLKKNY